MSSRFQVPGSRFPNPAVRVLLRKPSFLIRAAYCARQSREIIAAGPERGVRLMASGENLEPGTWNPERSWHAGRGVAYTAPAARTEVGRDSRKQPPPAARDEACVECNGDLALSRPLRRGTTEVGPVAVPSTRYQAPLFWRTQTDLGIRKPGTWNLERGTPMAPGTWNLEQFEAV